MSLILDALNRSRGEADRTAVPSLDSVHYTDTPAKPWRLWLVVGAGLVVVALLIWMVVPLLSGGAESPVSSTEKSAAQLAAEAARSEAQSAPASPPQSQPLQAKPRPAPQAVTLGGRIDRGDNNVSGSSVEPAGVAEASRPVSAAVTALYERAPANEPEATARDAVNSPAAEAVVEQPPLPTPAEATVTEDIPIDVAEVLRRAQQDLGQPRLSEHPVPALDTLSQQTKDRIPTVVYSAHDYLVDGQSSVTLNGNRLTTGQRSEGFQVKEILVDSVVLSWGGTDFRLRALNSWINL